MAVTVLLMVAPQAEAQVQSETMDRKETIADDSLPEELMLQKLSMLKNLRPPQNPSSIRKLFMFESEPRETSVGVGRVTEVWKIAPGYEIRFVADSTPPFALLDAWIERTLPHNAKFGDEPGVDTNVSWERYSLINPRWTQSGLLYVYEITVNSEHKWVLVPFPKPKGTKMGEQGGADHSPTAPESKPEDEVNAKTESEERSQ